MSIKKYLYKFYKVFIVSFFCIHVAFLACSSSVPLVVALMVKNEADVLVETLEPYVRAGVDSLLVYDTGSTDNTVEVAYEFFKKNNLKNSLVIEEPFIDFATSRNKALDYAEEKFPEAAFILMPDAEWYIKNADQLVAFCKAESQNPLRHDVYLMHIICPSLDFYTPRLITTRSKSRFVGKVHEVVAHRNVGKLDSNIYFEYSPSDYGREKSVKRWERDKDLLFQQYQENPADPRTVHYLAQTYLCLGDAKNAAKYYKLRTTMAGWDEENFISWYRLGQAYSMLVDQGDKEVSWNDAEEAYYTAFKLRSHRAEPLIAIAEHYLKLDDFDKACMYARHACEIPYPKDDILFIDKYLYDFKRWDILHRSAYYVKKYDLGVNSLWHALRSNKNAPHLWNNFNHYLNVNI